VAADFRPPTPDFCLLTFDFASAFAYDLADSIERDGFGGRKRKRTGYRLVSQWSLEACVNLMSSNTISIRIEGEYGSISGIHWSDVPPFAVISGVNGAGKTQLLEVLAATYQAWHPRLPDRHATPPQIRARAVIEGESFLPGEVFHSYGDWPELGQGSASEDQIKSTIQQIYADKKNEWLWKAMSDRIGTSVDEARKISLEEFYEHLTPGLLCGHSFPKSNLSLPFLFLSYSLLEKDALQRSMSEEAIGQLLGEPPWDLMNEILETSGLPFRVNSPELQRPASLINPRQFHLRLRDIERNQEIPFGSLSSGEKVIMSTALWRYGAEQIGRHYGLLLLDEPDAYLHPSLTRRFLDVIQRVFVEERGVRVIMSTHSPSTVALAPAGSLFEMRRVAPRICPAESKAHAIAVLTDGFVAVQESTRTVMVEGPTDPPFYQMIWDLLTERSAVSEPGPLEPSPSLLFIHGHGKDSIRTLVPQMRDKGLTNFQGIMDRDRLNTPSNGILILTRYAIENFLIDPLNMWLLLFEENCAPVIQGVSIPTGRGTYIRALPDAHLQKIADTVLSIVEGHLNDLRDDEKEREDISFINGKRLQYPRWLLYRSGKKMIEEFREVFGHKYLTDKNISRSYRRLNMVPTDLFAIFKAIQCGSKAGPPQ
jgi:hypothetical protein